MDRPERSNKSLFDCTVDYNDSKETRQILYEKVLAWFMEHEIFDEESIMQNDACIPQLEAPELLCDIAENVFNFKTSWDTRG